jgi:hypothetical protein
MNSSTGIGTGEEKVKVLLVELLRRLDATDELLWPSQPRKVAFVAQEGTVVKFLRFDGTGNPLQWIHHCECNFRVCQTSENKDVTYAAFHLLDDTQLWYHRLLNNSGPPTWEQFVLLITTQFEPHFTGTPLSMPALGGEVATREGVDDDVLFEAAV